MELRIDKLFVLVIDDAKLVRERVKKNFASMKINCELVEAVDGEDALFKVEKLDPQKTFIVLDLNMPKMNGVQFLTLLRAKKEWKETPVVINSATTHVEDIEKVNTLGVLDMAPKPISQKRLVSALLASYCEASSESEQKVEVTEKLKFLVADDEEFDRDCTARVLKQGFKDEIVIEFAKNGPEVHQKVREHDFDCMIFDYYLEDTDGATIIRKLREEGNESPMIILTGSGDESLATGVFKSGASDYRKKDGVSAAGLRWTIENAIEKTRLKKEADMQKIRSLRQARASALGTMAGGIAHEINNPLAVLQSQSFLLDKMIKKDSLDEEALRKISSTLSQTVDRVATVVHGLVQYSASGRIEKLQNSSIKELIEEVISFYQQRLEDENIECSFEFENDAQTVFVNTQDFSQALMNLIDNAMWAVKTFSSAKKWIRIKTFQNDSTTEVHIIDSGPGLDESTEDKMMEPFFTTKPTNQGMGLGLSVAQSLIKEMNGEIYFDRSQANTCFKIVVPNGDAKPLKSAA